MLTLPQLLQALGGRLLAKSGSGDGIGFPRVAIDSRQVQPGDLFLALPGQGRDGHDFIAAAVRQGARGVIGERLSETLPEDVLALRVDDSLAALQDMASWVRSGHAARVIGVTGSVGKTTCKEAIAGVLAQRYRVLKSEGNLNTEIGLPLTLLGLSAEHEMAVLEMGAYAQGDVRLLCRIARPEVGVVTNVGPVHLERLGSLEAIADAKAELVESLPPGGCAILNGDDPRTAAMADRTPARVLLYGISDHCHVRGANLVSHGLDGLTFRLLHEGQRIDGATSLLGRHNLYNALAAAAVGLQEGLTLGQIAEALAQLAISLRQRVLRCANGYTIIDDSYNASPPSVLAALDLLAEVPGRRLALLGDMLELGAYEEEGHRLVGRRAAAVVDALFLVGERACLTATGAAEAGLRDVRLLPSKEAATEALRRELRAGDVLLVKGSRGMALETVVSRLAS